MTQVGARRFSDVVVTPEMVKAAEEAVMLILCSELGPNYRWDWVVSEVLNALLRAERPAS